MTNLSEVKPDKATQLALLQQEANMMINARWQLEMRYRVNKRIGADKSVLDALQADLEKCEKYLAAIDDEVKAIAGEK